MFVTCHSFVKEIGWAGSSPISPGSMTHFTVAKCGGADKAENWAVGMTSENEKNGKAISLTPVSFHNRERGG